MRHLIVFIAGFSICLWGLSEWNFDWVGEPGYEWDGIEPDYFDINADYVFRIKVKSITEPSWVVVNLDINGDGEFSLREQILMTFQYKDSLGYVYIARTNFWKPMLSLPLSYYFSAQVGNIVKTSPLLLGPFPGSRVSFALIGDTLWDVTKPIFPLEVVINSPNNRFLLVNTGNVPITFGLSIDQSIESCWKAVDSYRHIGVNKYMLSAVFSDPSIGLPQHSWFNSENYEDVIMPMPKFAHREQFGIHRQSSGERVAPGDTVALWFNFVAPAGTDRLCKLEIQSIRIFIFATEEN